MVSLRSLGALGCSVPCSQARTCHAVCGTMLMIILPARLGRLGSGWLGQAGHSPQRRRVRLVQARLARLEASGLLTRVIESTASLAPVHGKATQRRGRARAGKLTFLPGGEEALSIAASFRLGAPESAHA